MEKTITVIPGDGIGPEITAAALRVLEALEPGLRFEQHSAGLAALPEHETLVPEATIESIRRTDATLKGPLTTPIGGGFTSINVDLRRRFDLYANLRPALSFPGTRSRYQDIDLITIRENTEGAYLSEGQRIDAARTRAESRMIITRAGSERIVRFAFDTARREGRRRVTAVHKANILKTTSGLFLEVAREVAATYGEIEFDEMIVDNACMQLVMNPHQFDVIVTTNLFGDILSDLCAGLVGGLGLAPGGNIGEQAAIFEAVHGSAPDIAGRGVANPCALLLAAALMLEHLGMAGSARRLRAAIRATLAAGDRVTPDLGGPGSTAEFAAAIQSRL